MHTNQRLEEETIRQCLGLRAQLAHSERLLEGVLNLTFILLLHPNQRERRIAGLERPLRGLDDWAIEAITVRERASRQRDAHRQDEQGRSRPDHARMIDRVAGGVKRQSTETQTVAAPKPIPRGAPPTRIRRTTWVRGSIRTT